MSSDHPSDVPSAATETSAHDTSEFELSLGSLIKLRGIALLEGLERHAPGSQEHAEGTASYAFAAAVVLGFDRGHAEAVRETAKLHDIGRVYVPAEVLAKPTAELDAGDREQLDGRFEAGYRLALGAGIPERVCEWIRRFGERYDGRGPGAIAGSSIPHESRIARAGCACDTLLAAPHAAPGPAERRRQAIERLRGAEGSELDPEAVAALVSVLERAAGAA